MKVCSKDRGHMTKITFGPIFSWPGLNGSLGEGVPCHKQPSSVGPLNHSRVQIKLYQGFACLKQPVLFVRVFFSDSLRQV